MIDPIPEFPIILLSLIFILIVIIVLRSGQIECPECEWCVQYTLIKPKKCERCNASA